MILGDNEVDPFNPSKIFTDWASGQIAPVKPVPTVGTTPIRKAPVSKQPLVLRSQANDPSMYDVAPVQADSELMTFVKENKIKLAAVGLLLLWRMSK